MRQRQLGLQKAGSWDNLIGIGLSTFAGIVWGLAGVFTRTLTAVGFGSIELGCLRCLGAGLCLLLVFAIGNPQVLKVNAQQLGICIGYGLCTYVFAFTSYAIAVDRAPMGIASVLMHLTPIWVTLMAFLVFHERIKKINILAIVVCLAGAMMATRIFESSGSLDLLGIGAAVVNSIVMALQIMIPAYFHKKVPASAMMIYGFLGAAVALAFLGDFSILGAIPAGMGWKVVGALGGVTLVCTVAGNGAYVLSGSYTDSTTVSLFCSVEVIVGILMGYLLYQETLTLVQILGAGVILLGALGPQLVEKFLKK